MPPPPPLVTVAKPLTRNVTEYAEFTGTIRAAASVDLKARVNGYLQAIHFRDGALVREGDLLFVIDPAPYEVELQSAKANLEKARAMLQLEEAQLQRTEQLVKRSAASKEEHDIAIAERAGAVAAVASAEAALRQTQLNLGYTEIRAPLAGRIGRHLVDVGNLVKAEDTLLARIESVDPIHAYFNVSENALLHSMEQEKGQADSNSVGDSQVFQLGLGDSSQFRFEGRLDFREFGVDSSTGTILRRALFSNADQSLVPGLFVRVRTAVGAARPRLLVEERAVASDQRGSYLLVVNDKSVVEYRPVTLGSLDGGLRVIEEGLRPEDLVVVNGLQRARPGGTVEPQLVEMNAELAHRSTGFVDKALAR